jgi:DNA-binding GntR family transcriptional regulator
LMLPERMTRSLHQHEALVEAIANHDTISARSAMVEHINDVERTILDSIL